MTSMSRLIPGHRALATPCFDAVETWKLNALERARGAAREQQAAGKHFVHVRTTLGFLLLLAVAQLLAWRLGAETAILTLLGLPSALLVQEFPRALFARLLGRSSRLLLSASGGQTELFGAPLAGAAQLAFVSVGSLANLLVAAATLLLRQKVTESAQASLAVLAGCQAAWGLGQALPLMPFRAGLAVTRRLRPVLRLAHAELSVLLLGGASALLASSAEGRVLLPVALAAVAMSLRRLAAVHLESHDECSGVAAIAQQAANHVRCDDPAAAIAAAQRGLALAHSLKWRISLNETLAWAAIGKPDPFIAHRALARLPASSLALELVAAYLSCCNRLDEAAELLEKARAHGYRAVAATRLQIEVLYRAGKYAAARALAQAERESLSAEDWQTIKRALGN
jgi:hypothetical protein